MKQDWIAGSSQKQDYHTWAEIRLSQIVSLLSHLGADGIQAFRDFKGKPLDKRYLPAGYDVRSKLYLRGSRVSGNRASRIAEGRAEVFALVKKVIENRTSEPSVANAAWDQLKFGLRVPDGVDDISKLTMQHLAKTPYEVDHQDSLAIHWTTEGGNTTNDAARWKLSDKENLRYITRTEHDKKPKEPDYLKYVGKEFTSDYAEGGQPNAKRIDGLPFLDAPAPSGSPV